MAVYALFYLAGTLTSVDVRSSLPVGVLFGVVFLKERVGLAKAFALALIFGGLAAVYLG